MQRKKQQDISFRQILLDLTNRTYEKHKEGLFKIKEKINHREERRTSSFRNSKRKSGLMQSKSFNKSLLNVADFNYAEARRSSISRTITLTADKSKKFLLR